MPRNRSLRLVEPAETTAPVVPPEAESLPDVLTQREAAKLLRVHVTWLIRHASEVPHWRAGATVRYSRRQLLAMIEGGAK